MCFKFMRRHQWTRIIIVMMLCIYIVNNVSLISVFATENQQVMGETRVIKEDMIKYIKENIHSYPQEYIEQNIELEQFVEIVIQESEIEGVRADVVLSQIILETGWLTFNNKANISQNNFGELKDQDGNYLSFDSINEGIRANVQNLKKENWSQNYEYRENIKKHVDGMANINSIPIAKQELEILQESDTVLDTVSDTVSEPLSTNQLEGINQTEEKDINNQLNQNISINTVENSTIKDDLSHQAEIQTLIIDGSGYVGETHKIRSYGTSENGVLYQFWIKDLGTNQWTMIQDYSKSSALWVPTKAGNYLYGVHIKDEKSTERLDAHLYKEISIKPREVKTLTIDGPGYVGGTHRIRSYATSKNGVLYQFWIKDLSTNQWTMIQDYSKSSALWVPTKAGNYLYGVHIKDEKSTERLDGYLYKEISIKPGEVKTLTIDGPGYVGGTHRIRSYGTSKNGALYQFWIKDLSTNQWTMIQDYSKSSALWVPTKAGDYLYGVHIKDEKSTERLDAHLYKKISIKPREIKELTIDGSGHAGETHRIRSYGTSENGILYQFWIKDLSTNQWTMIQDYSKSSAPWTPTKPGDYLYGVHIKDEKSTERLDAHLYKKISIKPREIKVLTIDGPGYVGGTHRIRSYGTSENGILYQFWIKDLSTNQWTMIQDYSKSSAPWIPTKPGDYLYGVHIKDEKSTERLDSHLYKKITINQSILEEFSIIPSNKKESKYVLSANGLSKNGVLYQFWIKDLSNNKWKMVQDYSNKNTYDWIQKEPGEFKLRVFIKDKKSKNTYDACKYKNITIDPTQITTLDEFNIEGTNLVGSKHTILANATSVNEVLYQFWIKDLSTNQWTMIQDYSKQNSTTWVPSKTGNYLYRVSIKDEYSFEQYDYDTSMNITIDNVKRYPINILPYDELPYASKSPRALTVNYDTDENGIPIYIFNGETHYHPVRIAQISLDFINGYIRTENPEYLERAELFAGKIYEQGIKIDDKVYFPYTFDFPLHDKPKNTMEAPWYSAMAQGQILSVFARLYAITGNPEYLVWSNQTFNTLNPNTNFLEEYCLVEYDKDGYLWLEEYPLEGGTRALNGFIFAIYGVYDYYLVNNSDEVKEVLQESMSTVERYVEDYRYEGGLSYYCLEHKVQSKAYHIIHINQLEMLYKMTDEMYFKEMSDNFRNDYSD